MGQNSCRSPCTGEEVVHHRHLVALPHQHIGEVRPDEASATGDEDALPGGRVEPAHRRVDLATGVEHVSCRVVGDRDCDSFVRDDRLAQQGNQKKKKRKRNGLV